MLAKVLAFTLLVASQPVQSSGAASSWCRANPARVGQCGAVHGRLSAANGTPTWRIWVIGTHHVLGVSGRSAQDSEEGTMLPANVRGAFGSNVFDTQLFADFDICPLERARPGHMQRVCVTSAHHLRATRSN